MYDIHKTIEDDLNPPRNKSSIALNSSRPITPYSYTSPIEWTGFVNNERVKILHISPSSSHKDDFIFEEYPTQLNHLKSDIIHLIDKKLKTLN